MGPQRNTIGDLPKPQSSKSLTAEKEEQKEMCQAEWGHMHSAPNHRAFPVKPEPLLRWRAAARIKAHIKKWRNGCSLTSSKDTRCTKYLTNQEVAAPSTQPWNQLWPEEPAAPTPEDLEALTELEALLFTHHGNMEAAYKYIINCVKPVQYSTVKGSVKGDAGFTKRELKIALHLKCSKEASSHELTPERLELLDTMFDSLLALLREKDVNEVSRPDFLRFPELLQREKELQNQLWESAGRNRNPELLIGHRLRQRLTERLHCSEEALELLERTSTALQLEPARTANLLCQLAGSTATPSDALASGVRSIMEIVHEFGAPNIGTRLEVLIAGWKLCSALTTTVVSLAARTNNNASQPSSVKACDKKMMSKPSKFTSRFRKKYVCKVDVAPSPSINRNTIMAALWQALPPGEVLWNLGCGAEVLPDEDFKTLLRIAWNLFDSLDVVGQLLGPVGLGRLRPKLDSLADVQLEHDVLARDPESAHVQLANVGVLMQQIASMVEADPRLARIAALFGTSYVVNRIRSTANSSVNLVAGAAGSSAAQVNRSALALAESLSQDVEELMGGRHVQVCLTSGEYSITPIVPRQVNPLATWHRDITAKVMENATVKDEVKSNGNPNIARGRSGSAPEVNNLRPMEKFLLGYNNLL